MKKKISLSKVLIASCMLSSLALGSAIASDITGVTPNGNTYNIEAVKVSGDTGFRQYTNFTLDKGDIANLQYNNYQNFVNIVDNQVNINGIVNTMQGTNFYNGHAIFVSPQGMVIGASGVLNVGSLSVLTPSLSQYGTFKNSYGTGDLSNYAVNAQGYQGLIQDSQGNIVVNGKIIAREAVNLYGSNITVQKTAQDSSNTGIIAGYKGTSPITQLSDAEAIFNSLVSNMQTNANAIKLDDKGNINLTANKVVSLTKTDDVTHEQMLEKVTTSVKLDNTIIASGNDISISSVSKHSVETTADKLNSALTLESIQDPLSLLGIEINEKFEGARAESKIDILNSKLYSQHDTNITSNAVTNFVVSTPDDSSASEYIYALGTETLSTINIQNSTLNAGNNITIKALSENTSDIGLKNNLMFFFEDDDNSQKNEEEKDHNIVLIVNQTTKSDTKSSLNNSILESKDVSLISRNSTNDKVELETEAKAKGKVGIGISSLIKNKQISTDTIVDNNSKIISDNGNANVISQNLSIVENTVKVAIKQEEDESEAQKEIADKAKKLSDVMENVQKQLSNASSDKVSKNNDGKDVSNNITDTEETTGYAQIGGTLVVNRAYINTNAKVQNSTITGASKTNIIAKTVDLTLNGTESSTEGENTTLGAGLAVIVNSQNNTTLANVLNKSNIYSDELNVDASTELPMNVGELKLTLKIPGLEEQTLLSANVDSNPEGWDFGSLETWELPEKESGSEESDNEGTYKATEDGDTEVKIFSDKGIWDDEESGPAISYEKFFNNSAKSSAEADTAAISGSFVYNAIKNNTEATIDTSTVSTNGGNVTVNAVNSVVNYNSAGAVDYIFSYLTEQIGGEDADIPAAGTAAIGGAVLVNAFNNNAKAVISASDIFATDADINVTSANEESYLSAAIMGSKGEYASIDGSVVVQTIDGSTIAKISDSKQIQANNVNVIAGNAIFSQAEKDDDDNVPVIDENTDLIQVKDARSAKDRNSNIIISGAFAQQEGNEGKASSGVAVGASVNVINIQRTVDASIENSNVTVANSANIKSDSGTQNINVALAGAFAGGVSTDKEKQDSANEGGTSKEETNGAQMFGDYAGWIEKLDKLVGKVSKFKERLAGNKATSSEAASTSITSELKDNTTQDGLKSANSKTVTETRDVLDEEGNPCLDSEGNKITEDVSVTYKPDENGVYKNDKGETLKDNDGNEVKIDESTSKSDLSSELANSDSVTGNTADSETSANNFSLAAAGAVNVYTNRSNISSKISNSTIKVNNKLNITSDYSNKMADAAGGLSKAGTVGAGAAVTVNNFNENVSSSLENSAIEQVNPTPYDINVLSNDYNKAIDVAIGVGIAKNEEEQEAFKIAIGGSFNVTTATSSSIANIIDSEINKANDVYVIANNYTDIYKGAGSLTISSGSGNSVGAGFAGNINILNGTTQSEINNTVGNENKKLEANNISVLTNNKTGRNNNILSAAVAGSVINNGSSAGFTVNGSIGTDIIENTITAQIIRANNISATGDIKVNGNSNIRTVNINNSTTYSSAESGVGVGLATVVDVIDNNITSKIENSNITNSKSVDIKSLLNEDLKFLAVNIGIETSGSWAVNVNAIVNVLENNINSYITNSTIKTIGDLSLASSQNIEIGGITLEGNGSSSGGAIGGNILVNVLKNNSETISDNKSKLSADGDVILSNKINENLNLNSAAVTASSSGTAAIAANINANIITNSSSAILSSDIEKANSVSVKATDTASIKERTGLVAATGGTISIGGVVSVNVMDKTTVAKINSDNITTTGVVSAEAKSENAFGATKDNEGKYIEKEIGNIEDIISEAQTQGGVDKLSSMKNWQYAINGSGAATAGINQTVIVKAIKNNVSAIIDKTNITSGGLNVVADDYTISNAVIGNVAGAGTISIGGGEYINVINNDVIAELTTGTKINSTGDITVNAKSKEVIRDIIIAAGGAGTATINGASTVNIATNNIASLIDCGVNISQANNVNVSVNNITDIQSADVSASGAGEVNVGGIFKINKLNGIATAKVGNETSVTKLNNISGNVNVNADSEEAFSAMLYSGGGAGVAEVSGVGIVNIIDSKTDAVINNTSVSANSGKIDVKASHYFNKGHDSISANLLQWMKNNKSQQVTKENFQNDFTPLVTTLGLNGSGVASVTGNVISNTISSEVNAKVLNSNISSNSGLNVSATQSATTFDAMSDISGAGVVSVVVNGIVNVFDNKTNAQIYGSEITNGGANVNASDHIAVNSTEFAATGAGVASVITANNTNVINNEVNANITNSKITGDANAEATSDISQNDMYVIATGSGFASVVVAPVINSFIGNTNAYILNSELKSGTNTVNSSTIINTGNLVPGGSGSGIGAAVNALIITNSILNETNAYIKDTSITDAVKTEVASNTNTEMYSLMASLTFNALGASVPVNGIVNVYNNNQNAYILNSSIDNGSVKVSSDATTIANTINGSVATNAIGAGASVNGLVNIFKNKNHSYIENTSVKNASSIDILANSTEDISNTDLGVSVGGLTAAVSANVLLNIIENETLSYIDLKDKNINTTGKMTLEANDNFAANNVTGVVAASMLTGVGAGVIINDINYTVKSQVSGNGNIDAGSVDILSETTTGLTNKVDSISAGIDSIAGNVVVNTIGGKCDTSAIEEETLKNEIDEAVASSQTSLLAIGKKVNSGSATDRGVISSINSKVNANNDIQISAKNTLKGYRASDETFSSDNVSVSAGSTAVPVGVHVTNIKNNTVATAENAVLSSKQGDITLSADNKIKAESNILQATASSGSMSGAVAYFNDKTLTKAVLNNSDVVANNGTLNIISKTDNTISANAKSGKVSGVSTGINIANTEDSSNTVSEIIGDDVNVLAKNINVSTTAGSSLTSELEEIAITGVNVDTVVNRTISNILSKALISALGNITATNDLNIISQNAGINLTDKFYAGSIALGQMTLDMQGVYANSEFLSGINSTNINVNAGNISIKNGVSATDDTIAGTICSIIEAKQGSVSLLNLNGIIKDAEIDSDTITHINSGSGTIKANNLNVTALTDRIASIGDSKVTLDRFELSAMDINATITGDNDITFTGNSAISNAINITMNDSAQTASKLFDANISIASAEATVVNSEVNTNTNITLGGNISSNHIAINSNVSRNAYASVKARSLSLANVNIINMDAINDGESVINIGFTTPDKYNYTNAMDVKATVNNLIETNMSDKSAALVAITKGHCNNTLSATNTLNLENANITSEGDINLAILSNNNSIRKQVSDTYGVLVAGGTTTYNNVSAETNFNINNSNINADNITLTSSSNFGDKNMGLIKYSGHKGAFVAEDSTRIESNIVQKSNLSINNAIINATTNFVANVLSDSYYQQKVMSDTDGFVAGGTPQSYITLTNNNTFTNGENATIYAGNVYINLDSSNNLTSEANLELDGFSSKIGSNPSAEINFTVNNKINNTGLIQADNLAQLNYMGNSENNLKQYTYLEVDAALAFGDVDGEIISNINNTLVIPATGNIKAGGDVISAFQKGDMTIDSHSYADKTWYACFGIPIHDRYHNYKKTDNMTSSITLDGNIVAGANNQKYLRIDKDGNAVETLGFKNGDYTFEEGGTLTGEEVKQNLLTELNKEKTESETYKDSLNDLLVENNEKIAENEEQISSNNEQITYLGSKETIDNSNLNAAMTENIKTQVVGEENEGKISEEQYNAMNQYFSENPPESTQEYIDYMTAEGFTEDQQTTVLTAYAGEQTKIVYVEMGDYTYQEYDNKIIMSETDQTERIAALNSENDTLTTANEQLTDKNADVTNTITNVENDIEELQTKITVAENTEFQDEEIVDSYVLTDINGSNGSIILTNIENTNIEGNGKFILPKSGLLVENYSNADLVFQNIRNSVGEDSGRLIINGKNYNDSIHTDNLANNVNCPNEETHTGIGGDGPHVITKYSTNNDISGVTIKNYFDSNNPTSDKLPSNITISGLVSSDADLYILNESGNVTIKNLINTVNKKIYATHGNIDVDMNSSPLVLGINDIIYAGGDISIKAGSIENNGIISAGSTNRNLTISNNMLSNLMVDPNTGIQNLINIALEGDNPSPYMNVTNNIKALYNAEKNEIQLFNMVQKGGNVSLSTTPTGSGQVIPNTGDYHVNVINNTDNKLIINDIVSDNNIYLNVKVLNSQKLDIDNVISTEGNINLDITNSEEVNINKISTDKGEINADLSAKTVGIEEFISKEGNINLDITNSTIINTIAASNNISIVQDTDDLCVKNIGIKGTDNVIPQMVDIKVNGDSSKLTIYNAYIKGANNGLGTYDLNGNRISDVKLCANNIIASATNIPSSSVGTKKNPNGFVLTLPEETLGIRSYGNGNSLALELTGKNNSIAETIVASVNSDNLNSRGVIFNKLYANDAYINTVDTRLTINDAYINNYAEIRNGYGSAYDSKWVIVDNDFHRLIYSRRDPASVQLYTALSGNFNLGMDESTKLTTNAPVLHYSPYVLVNTYSDYNSFYNAGIKETSVQQNFIKHKKNMETTLPVMDNSYLVTFDVAVDSELVSNVKILKISRTGAIIENDGTMKVKKVIPVNIKFNDDNIDVTVNAKVERIENGIAEVRFVDMPASVANQIMYRCYKKVKISVRNIEN